MRADVTADLVEPLPAGVSRQLVEAVEEAGLRASQPPEQLEVDGWLLRRLPGKARRARCVNALHAGERSLEDKLAECLRLFRDVSLPCYVRITPFSAPPDLDAALAARGWELEDPTRVLVHPRLADLPHLERPAGLSVQETDAEGYAAAVGALRGSRAREIAAHALRMRTCPVPYLGQVWRDEASGAVVACAQVARDGPLVGLYDVFTAPGWRGRGLARALCARVLHQAREAGAGIGYLQVDAANAPALAVYRRLGFAEAYGYHYRLAPGNDASAH